MNLVLMSIVSAVLGCVITEVTIGRINIRRGVKLDSIWNNLVGAVLFCVFFIMLIKIFPQNWVGY